MDVLRDLLHWHHRRKPPDSSTKGARDLCCSSVLDFSPSFQIKDVHIRYEDDLSLSSSFACGFFIESLTAQTCNENFEPSFVQRDHGQVGQSADSTVVILQLDRVHFPPRSTHLNWLSSTTWVDTWTWMPRCSAASAPRTWRWVVERAA